jgi:hypothetical protein
MMFSDLYLKAGALVFCIIALLGLGAYGGYTYGHSRASAEYVVKLVKLEKEKADAAQASIEKLDKEVKSVDKVEATRTKKLEHASQTYQLKKKDIQNDKTSIMRVADADGLWITTTECRESFASGSHNYTLAGSNHDTGTVPRALRCRVSEQAAAALVEIAEIADTRTEVLNSCISTLKALNESLQKEEKDAKGKEEKEGKAEEKDEHK